MILCFGVQLDHALAHRTPTMEWSCLTLQHPMHTVTVYMYSATLDIVVVITSHALLMEPGARWHVLVRYFFLTIYVFQNPWLATVEVSCLLFGWGDIGSYRWNPELELFPGPISVNTIPTCSLIIRTSNQTCPVNLKFHDSHLHRKCVGFVLIIRS